MKTKKTICVVTGSRAEYGLLYWLMREIKEDPELRLQTVVTGAHLSSDYGLTYKQIEKDGFVLDEKVKMLLSDDSEVGITKSLGYGVIGFADAFRRLKPDVVVLLGDRFEILAAAQAAMVAGIPIAHLSGGEVTEGAMDDRIRHAISKMAYYHFAAAEPYRRRLIQMGEDPRRVVNCGEPSLDNIRRLPLLSRGALEKELNFKLGPQTFLVTYHPATLSATTPENGMKKLLAALDRFPEAKIIMTKANADVGSKVLAGMVDSYAAGRPERVYAAGTLGQRRYLSAMRYCDAVIGNSSSGIVEAPAMKVPTVNIGSRQSGRLKALSIIDCAEDADAISRAIRSALSEPFKKKAQKTKSLYGDSNASHRIKNFLKKARYPKPAVKKFYDMAVSG